MVSSTKVNPITTKTLGEASGLIGDDIREIIGDGITMGKGGVTDKSITEEGATPHRSPDNVASSLPETRIRYTSRQTASSPSPTGVKQATQCLQRLDDRVT